MTPTQTIARQPQTSNPENLARHYGNIGISAVAAALYASKGGQERQTEKPVPVHVRNFLYELAP